MTRDEVAKKIHWSFIIWLAGLINVGAMLPQLVRIAQTRNTDGLALEMFVIYLLVQIAFTLEGYFSKNKMLMVCLGLSALVSTMIIALVLYLRYVA